MNDTDESVKAGLEIENNQPPRPESETPAEVLPTEVDGDDRVHEETEEVPDETKEQDPDELSHSIPPAAENIGQEERDIDDLVHEQKGITPESDDR